MWNVKDKGFRKDWHCYQGSIPPQELQDASSSLISANPRCKSGTKLSARMSSLWSRQRFRIARHQPNNRSMDEFMCFSQPNCISMGMPKMSKSQKQDTKPCPTASWICNLARKRRPIKHQHSKRGVALGRIPSLHTVFYTCFNINCQP